MATILTKIKLINRILNKFVSLYRLRNPTRRLRDTTSITNKNLTLLLRLPNLSHHLFQRKNSLQQKLRMQWNLNQHLHQQRKILFLPKIEVKMNSINMPRMSMYQLMKSKLLLLKLLQHTISTKLNLLLLRVSEKLLVMIPLTPF